VTITNRVSLKSVMAGVTPINDVPDAPTIGAATNVGTSRAFNNGSATVAYTARATGGPVTTFTATSTPGSFTGTGTSPITVTGLQSATSYTFTVSAANANGTQTSAATSSITATTVPATMSAPTPTNVGTSRAFNNGAASVAFTAPATGGSNITGYTVTSSPSGFTGTGSSSPITVTGLASATAYTYTITATNANGTSTASSASASVTSTTVPQAPTIGTATDGGTGTTVSVPFTAGATGGSAITGYTVTSSPGSITGTGASSPITVSGLTTGTAYTFTVTATNANGTSTASSASNSVTPAIPPAFESIATATSSTLSAVTFSSIPQTYKHLQIRFFINTNSGISDVKLSLNGSVMNSFHRLSGNATTTTAQTFGSADLIINIRAGIPAVGYLDIIDYASTTNNKVVKSFNGYHDNSTNSIVTLNSLLRDNTAAISSITLTVPSANFDGRIALYGIKG